MLLDQFQFDFDAFFLRGLRIDAQSLERVVERGEGGAALGFFDGEAFDFGGRGGGLLRELSGALVELDVICKQPGAFDAHAFQSHAPDRSRRVDEWSDLRFKSCRRALVGTRALFETGQFGAQCGVLFADARARAPAAARIRRAILRAAFS